EETVNDAFLANTNPFFTAPVSILHTFYLSKTALYDSLRLDAAGLNREAFEWGLRGMEKLIAEGRATNRQILSIADFSQPSYQKRLYIIDLEHYSLLFNTWVAHGKNSGKEMAASFSNRESSNMSSLGFYLTGNTYSGKHGYSLKLTGLEKGFNDNALNRAIVVHGADYVNESYASSQGYIGRSRGCPAIPRAVYRPIIDQIKEGTCLFIYYPSHNYLKKSGLLN
ncbi:MAG: murein L,D-transpeptidase catalytic domain family protein, partial [Flavitalea sp.]